MMSTSGRELRVTEKGRGYLAAQKRKVYAQLLKKLKSTGDVIVELIEQGDESKVEKNVAIWRHEYIEFIQTYDVLCSVLDDDEKTDLHRSMQSTSLR